MRRIASLRQHRNQIIRYFLVEPLIYWLLSGCILSTNMTKMLINVLHVNKWLIHSYIYVHISVCRLHVILRTMCCPSRHWKWEKKVKGWVSNCLFFFLRKCFTIYYIDKFICFIFMCMDTHTPMHTKAFMNTQRGHFNQFPTITLSSKVLHVLFCSQSPRRL